MLGVIERITAFLFVAHLYAKAMLVGSVFLAWIQRLAAL
jgi:hypothetical protein